VLGFTQIRHRLSCSADLPPEAANHVYTRLPSPTAPAATAKMLMGLARAEAKRIGLEKVRLTVDDDNPTSRHITGQRAGAQ
jgi:predicted acetyltransferase